MKSLSIEFEYQGSTYEEELKSLNFETDGTAIVSKDELNNFSDLMCLIQDKLGKQFQLCYNEEQREIYAFQLNDDGEPISQYGDVTVWKVFELNGTKKLQNGNTYKLQVDGSCLKLSYNPTITTSYEASYEVLSIENALEKLFDWNTNNLSLMKIEEDAIIETGFPYELDTEMNNNSSILAGNEIAMESTASKTTISSATVAEAVEEMTDVELTETVSAAETIAITETPTKVAVIDSGSPSVLLPIILVIISVVGLAACGAAGFFFWKLYKEQENTKKQQRRIHVLEQEQVQSQQNNADTQMLEEKLQAAYQTQKQLEQERDQMQQAQKNAVAGQDVLRKQLVQSNAVAASERQNLIMQYNDEIAEKDQQIQSLQKKLREAASRAEEYQQITTSLQNEIKKSHEVEKSQVASTRTANSLDELAKNVSLSTKMADGYADAKFLNVNASLTGEVQLSESSSYRTAPLLCIKNAVILNPYYYRDLPNDREQYDSLIRVKDVFQISGLIGNSVMYGLDHIYPAMVSILSDGNYCVERMGKIIVKVR